MTDNPQQYIQYPQQYLPPPPQAPQPGVIPLRPLDVGAMIGGSFKAMFRNWRPAILVPFVCYLVVAAAVVVPLVNMFASFPRITRDGPAFTPSDVANFVGSWLVLMLLVVLLGLAATVITQSVVTVVVARAVLGRTTSIGQALRAAGPRMVPLLGLSVLIGLIAGACAVVPFTVILILAIATNTPQLLLLAFLFFLGGLVAAAYFWISWVLAVPALILEPAPVLTAMRRSRWLVSGGWWRVFGILALVTIMVSVASNIAQLPVSAVQFSQFPSLMPTRIGQQPDPSAMFSVMFSPTVMILYSLLTAVVYAITQPFTIGVTTLLYHDLRIRKESFHLPLWEMSQQPDELAVSAEPTPRPEPTT
ncbi:hypothetical protein [Kutzneria sp. 744]|uniref:hypothetical protein n=1 Tax=Kutzneria sp. (strain 744) TaxID=345341 RepID=UPI0003EED6DA|nr:hypothetical protein [Kutzneria sp. 744]EWM17998.1 integral membrane protein [Kutzneria sp. 744]